MSSEAILRAAPSRQRPFAPYHKWDRDFFLIWMVLIWIGIVMGFGSDLINHIATHEAPYPIIVHVHATIFVGFLVLMTVQILFVRAGRADLHRTLGAAGTMLAAVMLLVGPATAFAVQRAHFPGSEPQFLAIQFGGISAFAVLVAAAVWMRNDAAAHKRLMLLAILAISDAGFSRWLGGDVHALLGTGFWPFFVELYLGADILILGMGAYDLITRKRLHPAYIAGAAWIFFAYQLPADFLYHNLAWKSFTTALVGH